MSNKSNTELDDHEENSLNATKDLVKKKLGLGEKDVIELSQVRDGRIIDLEDGMSVTFIYSAAAFNVQN